MKKYILLLSLGLGLLTTQESFAADQPCAANGFCYIKNAAAWTMYFYSKDKTLIATRGQSSPYSVQVSPDRFPIYVSEKNPYSETDPQAIRHTIEKPGCYTLFHFSNYYTLPLLCSWAPSQGPQPPKSAPQPAPQK